MTVTTSPTIGAHDPHAWSGIVVSPGPGRGAAIRFVPVRDGTAVDGVELIETACQVGPNAPNGTYARVAFDPFGAGTHPSDPDPPLAVEWSRTGTTSVIGRVRAEFAGALHAILYFPWDWSGTWSDPLGSPTATLADDETIQFHFSPAPHRVASASAGLTLQWDVDGRKTLEWSASMAPPPEPIGPIGTELRAAATAHGRTQPTVTGPWHGLVAAITHALHWTVALQPESGRRYVPAGRRWIFPHNGVPAGQQWTIFAWDALLNGIELAVDDVPLASETILTVLDTQYETGNIPNWRGRYGGTPDRSQPPIGSFCTLKIFLRSGQFDLVRTAFPRLARWSDWWRTTKGDRPRRAGPSAGLFTWGSDTARCSTNPPPWEIGADGRQRAAWESGQDDLPCWDEAGWDDQCETFQIDAVDLNSYLALDDECLSDLASRLGYADAEERYRIRYQQLRDRMNDRLWSEDEGLYLNRHASGRHDCRVGAAHFLPLVAGIPDADRATRMVEALFDPERFWGKHVVPTIARTDPAFTDQQYWRGSIWPPMNYLIYQGLRRYRFFDAAAELARRSVDLFFSCWRDRHWSCENFDSVQGTGAGHHFQSWGPLLALIGLEEFIDTKPWDGLTIGGTAITGSRLDRLAIGGHRWGVDATGPEVVVSLDDRQRLSIPHGTVLADVTVQAGTLSARVIRGDPGGIRSILPGTLTIDEASKGLCVHLTPP